MLLNVEERLSPPGGFVKDARKIANGLLGKTAPGDAELRRTTGDDKVATATPCEYAAERPEKFGMSLSSFEHCEVTSSTDTVGCDNVIDVRIHGLVMPTMKLLFVGNRLDFGSGDP